MIDLEVLHQTARTVISERPSAWFALFSIVLGILVLWSALARGKGRTSLHSDTAAEHVRLPRKDSHGRILDGPQAITSILMLLSPAVVIFTDLFQDMYTAFIGCVIGILILTKAWAQVSHHRNSKPIRGLRPEQVSKAREQSIETLKQVDTRATFTLIAAGVVFVALVGSWIPPSQEAYDLPTREAQNTAQSGRDQIRQALLNEYNITSVNFDACQNPASVKDFFVNDLDDHERRIIEQEKSTALLEHAAKNDPFDAPSVGVLTVEGTTACYHLLYDNTTGQATLVATADDSDAPTPAKLRR